MSECKEVSEVTEKQHEEQKNAEFEDGFDGESEESKNPDEDEYLNDSEEQDEFESMGMSMGMRHPVRC